MTRLLIGTKRDEPAWVWSSRSAFRRCSHDPIVIKRPDDSHLEWTIGGFEMIGSTQPKPRNDVVILLSGLNKEDVPVGSEVWSADP